MEVSYTLQDCRCWLNLSKFFHRQKLPKLWFIYLFRSICFIYVLYKSIGGSKQFGPVVLQGVPLLILLIYFNIIFRSPSSGSPIATSPEIFNILKTLPMFFFPGFKQRIIIFKSFNLYMKWLWTCLAMIGRICLWNTVSLPLSSKSLILNICIGWNSVSNTLNVCLVRHGSLVPINDVSGVNHSMKICGPIRHMLKRKKK